MRFKRCESRVGIFCDYAQDSVQCELDGGHEGRHASSDLPSHFSLNQKLSPQITWDGDERDYCPICEKPLESRSERTDLCAECLDKFDDDRSCGWGG